MMFLSASSCEVLHAKSVLTVGTSGVQELSECTTKVLSVRTPATRVPWQTETCGLRPKNRLFQVSPYVALVFHFVFFSFFLLCFAFFYLSLNQLGEKVAELHAPALGPELMVLHPGICRFYKRFYRCQG